MSYNKTNQERFNSDAQAVTIKTAVFEEHSSETKGGQTTSAHAQLGDKSIKDQAVNVNKQAAEIKTNTNINPPSKLITKAEIKIIKIKSIKEIVSLFLMQNLTISTIDKLQITKKNPENPF